MSPAAPPARRRHAPLLLALALAVLVWTVILGGAILSVWLT